MHACRQPEKASLSQDEHPNHRVSITRAFEIAATVDYLFAYAATAQAVEDHHFDLVFAAYIADDRVRQFLIENNPAAAREIAERMIEAQERGLWQPRSNASRAILDELAKEKLKAVS